MHGVNLHGRQQGGEFHYDIFDTRLKKSNKTQLYAHVYHHHHHVPEGLGVFPVP